ncbi:MAG: PEGA domain-containing protein [Bacteroidales bacterium]|nr:PEGA domain-containing protein [Bacteroidales bacterium]
MKKVLQSTVVLFMIFFLSGCATLFTGTHDTIHFSSDPEGAVVYKDGLKLCTTPCDVSMKRSVYNQEVTFKMDGYETRIVTLDREFNVVSVINLGSLLGWAIDAATGSIMKYTTKSYDIKLDKKEETALSRARKININTRKKIIEVYVME